MPWVTPTVIRGDNFHGPLPGGLRYIRDFITPEEEAELDECMGQGDHWLRHLRSRAQQFFGLIYYQTTHDMPELQPAGEEAQSGRPMEDLPDWLLPRVMETQVFSGAKEINQVAANEYLNVSGIGAHVEDPVSFGPNLATLSLLSPVHITLTPTDLKMNRTGVDHGNYIKVLLEPRSLFILQGESRYKYRHGIRRSKLVPLPDGTTVNRAKDGYRRVSLTFRELLETRRQLESDVELEPQMTAAERLGFAKDHTKSDSD
jgi:alkylated DNA repair dioxygenase AlkB